MDWGGCSEVEVLHGKVSGRPILKGSRVTADFVLENYDEGYAPVEVEWMFRLCVGRVQAVIDYAEQSGASCRGSSA